MTADDFMPWSMLTAGLILAFCGIGLILNRTPEGTPVVFFAAACCIFAGWSMLAFPGFWGIPT